MLYIVRGIFINWLQHIGLIAIKIGIKYQRNIRMIAQWFKQGLQKNGPSIQMYACSVF